jgi:CHAT domain-containing protein
MIGLSRCLFLAGTPSIVASLWEVPDNSTTELMIKFYQKLGRTSNKAQALCDAMRSLLPQYRNSPLCWAAFVLIGEA